MKNYWLDKKKKININQRFLDEAIACSKKWEKNGLLPGIDKNYSRATCAVLMESCRLRNECQSDEEYEAYLKDFHERTRMVLESNRSQ